MIIGQKIMRGRHTWSRSHNERSGFTHAGKGFAYRHSGVFVCASPIRENLIRPLDLIEQWTSAKTELRINADGSQMPLHSFFDLFKSKSLIRSMDGRMLYTESGQRVVIQMRLHFG